MQIQLTVLTKVSSLRLQTDVSFGSSCADQRLYAPQLLLTAPCWSYYPADLPAEQLVWVLPNSLQAASGQGTRSTHLHCLEECSWCGLKWGCFHEPVLHPTCTVATSTSHTDGKQCRCLHCDCLAEALENSYCWNTISITNRNKKHLKQIT